MSEYTVVIEEDENGDLILPISDEILEKLGVKIGDEINIEKTENGFKLYK